LFEGVEVTRKKFNEIVGCSLKPFSYKESDLQGINTLAYFIVSAEVQRNNIYGIVGCCLKPFVRLIR
jgi:hypothetical protein